jgi:hypothetical protein
MRILLPTTITEPMIGAATTIPAVDTANGEVLWVPSGTYAINDLRVYAGGVYACVKAHTATAASKPPPQDAANWLFKEPTNRMAPFDEYIYTKARQPGALTYVLNPGFITGFAMYGVEADASAFEYRESPGGAVLVSAAGPLWEQAYGHWELLFGDLQRTEKWTSPLLPMRPAGELTVTLTRNNADVEAAVGWLGVGRWVTLFAPGRDFGGTEYGIEVTPKSYAYFERSKTNDGTYKRQPGRKAKVVTGSVVIDSKQAPQVDGWLRHILDVPVAVDFSDLPRYRHLSTVGFLTGSLKTDSWGITRMNFTLEGNV